MNYVDRVAPYGTSPPPEPVAGSISVISQSGTVAWAMNQLASDRGAGLRLILGVGNEAVLGLGDMFAWAAADPQTKVVCTLHRDDARRRGDRPRSGCAARGAQAGAGLRARRTERGGSAFDRGAHRGARREHGPPRRVAPAVAARSWWRTRSRCSRRPCCCRTARSMRTTGIAAALQSGGACTLFAEAAGAHGLSLPEFSTATKRKLRTALPHYASQNNPLDVTGQAAVETDMFCAALEALARDPVGRVRRVRRVPSPRGGRGRVGGADPARRAPAPEGDRGRVRVGGDGSARLRHGGQAGSSLAPALPFLQGHRAADGCDPRPGRAPRCARAERSATGRRIRTARKALRLLRGRSGPLDEARAAELLRLYGVRRPVERAAATPAAAAAAAARDRVPGRGEGAGAGAAPQGEARGRSARAREPHRRSRSAADEVLQAARRAGAATPRVLVQRMVAGRRGAGRRGGRRARSAPCITIRPGGALAEAGAATFVAAPLTPAQALAFVAVAGRTLRARRGQARPPGGRPGGGGDRPGGPRPARPVDLARGEPAAGRRARRRRRRRAGRSPAARVIYGLVAALGWGLADFGGAVVGPPDRQPLHGDRGQGLQRALHDGAARVRGEHDLGTLGPYIGFVALNGIASAVAYVTHYRALQLGPVAIVSPIGATYAVVGCRARDRRPGRTARRGRDRRRCGHGGRRDARLDGPPQGRAGPARACPPGLPWAIVPAVMFGVGGFLLGYLSQRVGWVVGALGLADGAARRFSRSRSVVPEALRRSG